jgi:hypothetical protein
VFYRNYAGCFQVLYGELDSGSLDVGIGADTGNGRPRFAFVVQPGQDGDCNKLLSVCEVGSA